jgi:hypothetical protein
MKRSYHEFCAVDDPYLHRHRLADDEPPAGVDAPLTATPVLARQKILPGIQAVAFSRRRLKAHC